MHGRLLLANYGAPSVSAKGSIPFTSGITGPSLNAWA